MRHLYVLAVALVAGGVVRVTSASAVDANTLRASWNSQIIQNKQADADDLSRMQDAAMVQRFVRAKLLVPVPRSTRHYYTKYIPDKYRYLRPWSKLFLDRLSSQYYARFKKKLCVTSMVRTVALQQALAKRNGNAAAAQGPRQSSHLTGATLDISKKGMTQSELDWMRRVLFSLREGGHLYAVEEFNQPTFHIMVYKDYPRYVANLEEKQRARQQSD